MSKCNEDYIKEAAYFLWEQAGRPMGQDEKFWSMALEQFSSCKKSKSSACCSKKSCSSTSAASKKPVVKSASKATAKK